MPIGTGACPSDLHNFSHDLVFVHVSPYRLLPPKAGSVILENCRGETKIGQVNLWEHKVSELRLS